MSPTEMHASKLGFSGLRIAAMSLQNLPYRPRGIFLPPDDVCIRYSRFFRLLGAS